MDLEDLFTDALFKFDDVLQASLNVAHSAGGPGEALPAGTRPRRGDIVAVDRGLFWHYGIFENDNAVYHYQDAARLGVKGRIARTSFAEFVAAAEDYFILGFSGSPTPWAIRVDYTAEGQGERPQLEPALRRGGVYSLEPDAVIAAARSRLEDGDYHLLENNCEHFALTCNVGCKTSLQVARFEDVLAALAGRFHDAR